MTHLRLHLQWRKSRKIIEYVISSLQWGCGCSLLIIDDSPSIIVYPQPMHDNYPFRTTVSNDHVHGCALVDLNYFEMTRCRKSRQKICKLMCAWLVRCGVKGLFTALVTDPICPLLLNRILFLGPWTWNIFVDCRVKILVKLFEGSKLWTYPKGLFTALISRTTSQKIIHDSQWKYFVSVDIGNVPRYKILFSKRGKLECD